MRFQKRILTSPQRSGRKFTISIITAASTEQRYQSLVRLCNSLANADYLGYKNIRLVFNIDVSTSARVVEYANGFLWPHGFKLINVRVKEGGLVTAVAESWYPSSPEDHGIILEDDIEVSPYFFKWLLNALEAHYADPDPRVVGISLYTPRTVEHIAGRQRFRIDPSTILSGNVYGQPLPCSWGALWLPSPWMKFLSYMSTRLETEDEVTVADTTVSVPGSLTMFWKRSWKKYMTEIMYTNELYMIYPNFPNQVSLSTNHVELGEHIVSEKDREKRLADFTVPLFEDSTFQMLKHEFGIEDPFKFPPTLREIKMFDIFSRPIVDLECLVDEGCIARYPPQVPSPSSVLNKLWSSRRNHVCQNIPFNDNYLMKDGAKLTLVIDTGERCDLRILAKQLEYYSRSSDIVAILVIWNDTLRPPPPSVQTGTLYVTFLPQFQSSRNNKFNPSSKIITDAVMIIELGIRVHLDDVHDAHKLWLEHQQNIIGFSPIQREQKPEGYIGVRSSAMILHSRFLRMYSCDEGMAYVHYQVEKRGCEDLAMSLFVSVDTNVLAPLLSHPSNRLIQFVDRQHQPQRYEACTEVLTQYFYGRSNPPVQKDEIGTFAGGDLVYCFFDDLLGSWTGNDDSSAVLCKSAWEFY